MAWVWAGIGNLKKMGENAVGMAWKAKEDWMGRGENNGERMRHNAVWFGMNEEIKKQEFEERWRKLKKEIQGRMKVELAERMEKARKEIIEQLDKEKKKNSMKSTKKNCCQVI